MSFKKSAPFTKYITKTDRTTAGYAGDLELVMSTYNLIKHGSNYSERTWCLWFYSKDEWSNFNANIANFNNFKSFKYKIKLLGNKVAYPAPNQANGVLKRITIAIPLKSLYNFWRSIEMLLINCKIEIKLKWANYCFGCKWKW